MVFKLTLSMITYIVSPDAMTDKSKGFSKLITNVVISLILIVTVPSIFREAYKLQYKLLNTNAIYQIITGKTSSSNPDANSGAALKDVAREHAEEMTFNLYTAFIYRYGTEDATDDKARYPIYESGTKCGDIDCILELDVVNADGDGKNGFANEYKILLSTVCGGVVAYFFLIFCLDAATRAIKLGVLQIISPIPILSMIDPKAGNEKVKKWASNCGKEFAGLFIRLAGVYFAMEIIHLMFDPDFGLHYYNSEGMIGDPINSIFVKVFVILGALMFAKQLPQFIESVLGFKLSGDGFSLGKRLKSIPGYGLAKGAAKIAGAGAIGFAGGMAANAWAAGKQNFGWDKSKGVMRNLGNNLWGGVRGLGSMAAGGMSGLGRGAISKEKNMFKAGAAGTKGAVNARNVRDKRQKYGEAGVKGWANRRLDDVNRWAGTNTRLDDREDELKALQYGPDGLEGLQDNLFAAQQEAAQFSDFQYLKDAKGMSLDSSWYNKQMTFMDDYESQTGQTVDREREITRMIEIATGVDNETAEHYKKQLIGKNAADAKVLDAQQKVQAKQVEIRQQNKKIDDQKKVDALKNQK